MYVHIHTYMYMYMKNQVCSAKRKKVQTLDSCFRLLALMYMYVYTCTYSVHDLTEYWYPAAIIVLIMGNKYWHLSLLFPPPHRQTSPSNPPYVYTCTCTYMYTTCTCHIRMQHVILHLFSSFVKVYMYMYMYLRMYMYILYYCGW